MIFFNINLIGEGSVSLADPLSCEFLLNRSLAIDLVLTSGDFSEWSDSEFSCSVLIDRPLKNDYVQIDFAVECQKIIRRQL